MFYVCDTNIAYHGSRGEDMKKAIKDHISPESSEPKLAITPIPILEVLTSQYSYQVKKDVCSWIVNNIDEYLNNQDIYIPKILGIYDPNAPDEWLDLLINLAKDYANSNSENQIISIKNIKFQGKVYTFSKIIEKLTIHRDFQYQDFYNVTTGHINEYFSADNQPYSANRKFTQPQKKLVDEALEKFHSDNIMDSLIIPQICNSWLNGYSCSKYMSAIKLKKDKEHRNYIDVSPAYIKDYNDQFKILDKDLTIYKKTYYSFLEELISMNFAMDSTGNDLGDYTLLLYLGGGNKLFSAETSYKPSGKQGWASRMMRIPECKDFVVPFYSQKL